MRLESGVPELQRQDQANENDKSKQELDNLVAKIGERDISAADIVLNLVQSAECHVIQNCLDRFLIDEECSKRGVKPAPEEVSSEVSAFRQRNKLLTGDETHRWLSSMHMSEYDFLSFCEYAVKLTKLKAVLFEKRLEEYFVYRQFQLRSVELYKIVLAREEAAREIISSVRDGESFLEYARKYSLDQKTAKAGGYTGKILLSDLQPVAQDLILKARPGDLVGPVNVYKNYEIYLLESIDLPSFDDVELRQKLEDELFTQWLVDTRSRSGMNVCV